jgi:hypothetical protein
MLMRIRLRDKFLCGSGPATLVPAPTLLCNKPTGDVVAQWGCGGSAGMWWLSHGCGGSVSYGDWVNQTATQQFRVRSLCPPQSPEGRQEH